MTKGSSRLPVFTLSDAEGIARTIKSLNHFQKFCFGYYFDGEFLGFVEFAARLRAGNHIGRIFTHRPRCVATQSVKTKVLPLSGPERAARSGFIILMPRESNFFIISRVLAPEK